MKLGLTPARHPRTIADQRELYEGAPSPDRRTLRIPIPDLALYRGVKKFESPGVHLLIESVSRVKSDTETTKLADIKLRPRSGSVYSLVRAVRFGDRGGGTSDRRALAQGGGGCELMLRSGSG